MGDYISFENALFVTFISILAVFVVLILISFLIQGLKAVGEDKKEKEVAKKEDTKVENKVVKSNIKEENEEELIAVISAAIAMSLGVELPKVKIKTIKRVANKSWSLVGKREKINKF